MSGLTFDELQLRSTERCERWHRDGTEPWSGADWSNAMCGEAGEAANVVKKIRRHETGMVDESPQQRDARISDLIENLAEELGDLVSYAVLVADYYGLDLGRCVIDKFNLVSYREGFPERISGAQ